MNAKGLLYFALFLCGGWFARIARGADPPVGVHLTGHASWNNQTRQFEIVMEGYDYYYRKEWSGDQEHIKPDSRGFYIIALAMGDFGGETSLSWNELNSGRGGGNYAKDGKERAFVARRLWRGDTFRGIPPDELRESLEYKRHIEEFLAPVSLEHFPTPCVIKWKHSAIDGDGYDVYTIEKVEFTYRHDPKFFADARKKYFGKTEANQPLDAPATSRDKVSR